MNWRTNLIIILLVFSACKQEKKAENNSSKNNTKEITSSYLIEVDELQDIIASDAIKIVDFRKPGVYAKEHIPGALNIWRTDIESPSYPYKGMMASKQQLENLFSSLGIKSGQTLIVYDDIGLCDAARLWWVLQNYGYTNVRLLHGGIAAWKTAKGTVTNTETPIKTSHFKLPENSPFNYYASKEEVLKAINKNHLLIDTRTLDEFTGKMHKKDAFKGGRIPTSKRVDWAEAIAYATTKKMKSKKDLEQIYSRLTSSKNDSIIVYCHSGVRSAHTTFVLTQLLVYKQVKNYDGSWVEWSHFKELPFKQDSLTTKF